MSELKATTVYDAYWTANSTGQGTGILVYLKSEADKVIAEKDKELRHHKYKRCLAMARWCEECCYSYDLMEKVYGLVDCVKWRWYDKWRKRWLELAEKFEPNKSTAQ